ncbi:TetR family transcriptional regulator [Aureimonas populi]|uniref:TetR family transcriptional regulator n=1 Tax=Aureimonas populi TaxID=1701758 RepID=A0ABW5CNI9_9HYPH|nr:TetR family transcriptional regulator [Aureimonas populi]
MRRTKSAALETREALLDAAEAVFHEKGVSAATLNDIARAACLTRGAIYWHFADKAALFEAMQERGRLPQEYMAAFMKAAGSNDPFQRILDISLDALRYLASNERSQRICSIMLLRCEYVGEMGEVLARMRSADSDVHNVVRAIFLDASERGLLSSRWTPDSAALAHVACMAGLINQWLRSEKEFDILSVGEPMLSALFASFAEPSCCPEGAGTQS